MKSRFVVASLGVVGRRMAISVAVVAVVAVVVAVLVVAFFSGDCCGVSNCRANVVEMVVDDEM